VQPTGVGGVLVEAPRLGQRVLFGALALQGTLSHHVEHSVPRRRDGGQGLAHQPLRSPRPLPAPGGQQPPQVPGGHVGGDVAGQALPGSCLATPHMGHQQPAKDQQVAIAEIGLEGGKPTRYCLRHPGDPEHGWPLEGTRSVCFTHTPPYPSRGHPATALFVLPPPSRRAKRQDNHPTIHCQLSTLSTNAL
jgi:hypothetical protein